MFIVTPDRRMARRAIRGFDSNHLAGRIRFGDIPRAISSALDKLGDLAGGTREELLEADAAGRRHVMELI